MLKKIAASRYLHLFSRPAAGLHKSRPAKSAAYGSMQIFAGVPWGGGVIASNESVVVENGDFRFFRSLSSEHFTYIHGHKTACT